MNPRIPRLVLGALVVVTLATLAGAFYDWYANGQADLLMFLRIALVLIGLLVLYQAANHHAIDAAADRCLRCGAKTFETRRSLDRRLVATCFVCGSETVPIPVGQRGTVSG